MGRAGWGLRVLAGRLTQGGPTALRFPRGTFLHLLIDLRLAPQVPRASSEWQAQVEQREHCFPRGKSQIRSWVSSSLCDSVPPHLQKTSPSHSSQGAARTMGSPQARCLPDGNCLALHSVHSFLTVHVTSSMKSSWIQLDAAKLMQHQSPPPPVSARALIAWTVLG